MSLENKTELETFNNKNAIEEESINNETNSQSENNQIQTEKIYQTLDEFNDVYEDSKLLLKNYIEGNLTLFDLSQKIINNKIPKEFRIILYKICFNVIEFNNPKKWQENLNQKRNYYYNEVNKYINSNKNIISFFNCSDIKGTKNYDKLYKLLPKNDEHLLALIKLDVERTFQDLDLFKNPAIKEMLCKILYIFSKENSDPSYCQGMNEICGTLLYIFLPGMTCSENEDNFLDDITQNKNDITQNKNDITLNKNDITQNKNDISYIEKLYNFLTNDIYFEADLYIIFNEIMSRDLKELYTYNNERYRNKKYEYDKSNLTYEEVEKTDESELVKRIKRLFYIKLKEIDSSLFEELVNKIDPDIFLLRWILCLLNREISLKNVMWLWDCIFFYELVEFTVNNEEKDLPRLNFLDSICISMILNIKDELVSCEKGTVMMFLLQYPNEFNLREIILNAIKLSKEKKIWENEKLNEKIYNI